MESFFKNFDAAQLKASEIVENSHGNVGKKYVVKRRNFGDILVSLCLLFLVSAVTFQFGAAANTYLATFIVVASVCLAAVYCFGVDYLQFENGDTLVFSQNASLFRRRTRIPLSTVQFVGIGSGDKFPGLENRHLVYIQHGNQILPLRQFRVGREAVVLAKEIRQFMGV